VICQAYVEGVSDPPGRCLVKAMGIEGMSARKVSAWPPSSTPRSRLRLRRSTPPVRYLWIDALTQRVGGAGGQRVRW